MEYKIQNTDAPRPNFEKHGGLLPVIVQDVDSHVVYVLTHTREAELLETQQNGRMVFYSVYREMRDDGVLADGTELWVEDIFLDSQGDSFLYLVRSGKEKIDVCQRRKPFFRFWLGGIQNTVKCLKDKLRKIRGKSMSENQNEIEATGVVETVYTTRTGMNEADPYEHGHGWKQASLGTRVLVESHDAGTHQRWMVWQRPEKTRQKQKSEKSA